MNGIPRAAWALAAAAAVAIAIGTLARGFIGSEWHYDSNLVVESLPSAMPFILAAAVVTGAFRWPATRGWLLIGAALLVLRGILEVGADWWIAGFPNRVPMEQSELERAVLYVRFVGSELALIAAFATLAIALWRSTSRQPPWGTWRRLGIIAAAALGVAAAAGAAMLGSTAIAISADQLTEAVYWLLEGLGLAAAAALAVAALASVPDRHGLPELIIATGATIFTVSSGGTDWLLAIIGLATVSPDALLTLSRGAMAGPLVVAVGFAATQIFPRRKP